MFKKFLRFTFSLLLILSVLLTLNFLVIKKISSKKMVKENINKINYPKNNDYVVKTFINEIGDIKKVDINNEFNIFLEKNILGEDVLIDREKIGSKLGETNTEKILKDQCKRINSYNLYYKYKNYYKLLIIITSLIIILTCLLYLLTTSSILSVFNMLSINSIIILFINSIVYLITRYTSFTGNFHALYLNREMYNYLSILKSILIYNTIISVSLVIIDIIISVISKKILEKKGVANLDDFLSNY